MSASEETELCHCGRPLHYTSPELKKVIDGFIRVLGPDLVMTVGSRKWAVPRHYIALHGLKASELPTLGFREINVE